MNNIFLLLLIVIIALLVVFIALLAYFGHRFLKLKNQNKIIEKPVSLLHNYKDTSANNFHVEPIDIPSDVMESLRASPMKVVPQSVYCVDHPEIFSQGRCAISYEPLCENCMSKQEEILIGRKYLDLYLDSTWSELLMIRESRDLRKSYLELKKKLWDVEGLPVLVQGHFKINVEDDQVEEYIVISSREEDIDRIKKEFKI
jgi:hypothetical protein